MSVKAMVDGNYRFVFFVRSYCPHCHMFAGNFEGEDRIVYYQARYVEVDKATVLSRACDRDYCIEARAGKKEESACRRLEICPFAATGEAAVNCSAQYSRSCGFARPDIAFDGLPDKTVTLARA
jgi:hypothetical protein